MNVPRVALWHYLAYTALVLAVLVLFFLPEEWHDIKDLASAGAQRAVQGAMTYLLEGASRAWFAVGGVALLALCLYGYASLRRRINDLEIRLQSLELEDMRASQSEIEPARVDEAHAALPSVLPQPALVGLSTNGTVIPAAEQRRVADEVRGPADQLAMLLQATRRCKYLRVKPELPERPWVLGFACHKGNVRPQNQDYGFYFLIGGRQVLVIADGCGGTPHGQRAAYLAAVQAVSSIVKTYGTGKWYACDPQVIARQAILEASSRLENEGKRLHLVNPRDGLRTTLIVLIGQESEVTFSYIGDGGGCIVRTSGAVEHFLAPQKAAPDQPNVLAASLGPQMQGEPVVGTIQRTPGDLVLVGTDGVFDRVEEYFPKDVLRAAIQFKGDLMTTAKLIVEELAAKQDDLGYICDDNLTLGIMGDGTAPVLAAGFWNVPKVPQKETNASQAEEVSNVQSR